MAKHTHAFTLIELLVVISVISLLVAILMPALSKARKAAYAVQCMNNLKQQALAANSYAVDHKEHVPNYYENYPGAPHQDSGGAAAMWTYRVWPYLNKNRRIYRCPSYQIIPGRYNGASNPYNDNSFQFWALVNANVNPAIIQNNAPFVQVDYNTPGAGGGVVSGHMVTKAADNPYLRLSTMHKNEMGYKGLSDYPLLAEVRHSWTNGNLSSPRGIYLAYGSNPNHANLNALKHGTQFADAPNLLPTVGGYTQNPNGSWYTDYLFSTVHNDGLNVPMADGHVEYFTRTSVFTDFPF